MALKKALIVSLFCFQAFAMEIKDGDRDYLFRLGPSTYHVGNKKDIEKFGYIRRYLQEHPDSPAIIKMNDKIIFDFKTLLEEIEPGASKISPTAFLRFVEISKEPKFDYFSDVVDSLSIYEEIFKLAKMLGNDEILKIRNHKGFEAFIATLTAKLDNEKLNTIYEIIMDQTGDALEKMKITKEILRTIKTQEIIQTAEEFVDEFKKAVDTHKIQKRYLELIEKIENGKGTIKDLKEMQILLDQAKKEKLPKNLLHQMTKDFSYCKGLLIPPEKLMQKPKDQNPAD